MINMLLSIDITSETESRLREQAEAAGMDVQTYVSELIEQAAARPSLEEQLAPVRKAFAQSGVSDQELIADITEAQAEYRASNQKKTA
jgi:predicted DNA binding CopG/RHH family protein